MGRPFGFKAKAVSRRGVSISAFEGRKWPPFGENRYLNRYLAVAPENTRNGRDYPDHSHRWKLPEPERFHFVAPGGPPRF